MSKRISLYIWCKGVEHRRHIVICMKEECACEVFRNKITEIREQGEKKQMEKFNSEIRREYRWDSANLFQRRM